MTLTILEEAEQELEEAFEYYENILPGLGEKYLDSFQNGLDRIREHPNAWAPIEANIRRCILSKFPYSIIYAVEGEDIFVLALAHHHRRPRYWSNRQ